MPRSSRESTTGPCGTSIATATTVALPAIQRITSHSNARPAPLCECAFCCDAAANMKNAGLMPFRTPVDGSKPCECLLVDHDVPPVTHEPPQRLPSLYRRSQARLPTGHPLWPARRGTCPVQVLEAQEISGSSQRVGPPGRSIMRRLTGDRVLLLLLVRRHPGVDLQRPSSPTPITSAPVRRIRT